MSVLNLIRVILLGFHLRFFVQRTLNKNTRNINVAMFNEFCVMTQNAGFCSLPFVKERSINQGCPISPYLFVTMAETLAHKLYENPLVKGVTVFQVKKLLSQYADDTFLFLNFDLTEINAVLDTLDLIETNTGLKISYDKTTLYRVGSAQHTNAQMITKKQLRWLDGDVELLGVVIPNGKSSYDPYHNILQKTQLISKKWSRRNLTLMGKILIINTLMSSLYVYKMMVLANLTKHQISAIYQCFKNFMWNGKCSKIKLELLQMPKDYGGLKMVDIDIKQNAIKINWVPKICNRGDLEYAYGWLLPQIKAKIWEINLAPMHVNKLIPYDSHWRRVLHSWCRYHYVETFSGEEVLNEILWFNSNICVMGKPIVNFQCMNMGPVILKDILDDRGNKVSYQQINQKFDNNLTWFEYKQLMSAIPEIWWYLSKNGLVTKLQRIELKEITMRQKVSSYVYNFIFC